MNKIQKAEMNVYEALGVKQFKKFVLWLRDNLPAKATKGLSKEEKLAIMRNTPSNYSIGNVADLDAVKNFKKKIRYNAKVHLVGMASSIFYFTSLALNPGSIFVPFVVIHSIFFPINTYCVMLQRYNNIRINELIKKMTPRYERQKNVIREEIKKDDNEILSHEYVMTNDKDEREVVTIDEIIDNSSIEQLRKMKETLEKFVRESDNCKMNNNNPITKENIIGFNTDKKKLLKLVYR